MRSVDLWPHLLTLPDEAGQLQPEQVALQLAQGMGDRLSTPDQSYGSWLPYPYWAGWQLHNPDQHPQTWLLSYVLPTQDSTAIWLQSGTGSWQAVPEWHPQGLRTWFGGHLWPVWQITCQRLIRTDLLSLQRIAHNLLSNAVRYTPPGGDVLLACKKHQGRLWLLCWDNGPGMQAEQAKQCFEAFTRFDPDQKVPEGLGLGLFSVRELARGLGAPTWLQSRPGLGTCIGVALDEASQPV